MQPEMKRSEATRPATMKAVRLQGRGGPEQLVFEKAPLPALRPGEALVRVYASAITPAELSWEETYKHQDGSPRVPSIPGHDVSGIVEALAPGVTELSLDEAVYGLVDFPRDGSAAEYVTVPAADLAPKPQTLDHVHAAAVPLSGLTAWQALFEHAGLAKEQRVLIHRGAGGVGTYAVQLARWRGARVIATASSNNIEFLERLGADQVVDYQNTRFEEEIEPVDVVLDTIGGETAERSWRVLRPGGILVTLVKPIRPEEAAAHGARGLFFIVKPSRAQLIEMGQLIDAGSIEPIVADVLPLARAKEAFETGAGGHVRGKIVLKLVE